MENDNPIDSAELLGTLSKLGAITGAELQGAPADPAAAAAMPAMPAPPGMDPSAMMGGAPAGGDPAAAAAGGDPSAAAAGGAPPVDPMTEAIMQLGDGQMQLLSKMDQLMQVFGFIVDHLGLKVPASQLLQMGGTLGGGKKAEVPPQLSPPLEIKDGTDDIDEPARTEVSPYYHRYEEGDSAPKVAEAAPLKTPLVLGETAAPGAGNFLRLKTGLVAAPRQNRRAAEAMRIRRGR